MDSAQRQPVPHSLMQLEVRTTTTTMYNHGPMERGAEAAGSGRSPGDATMCCEMLVDPPTSDTDLRQAQAMHAYRVHRMILLEVGSPLATPWLKEIGRALTPSGASRQAARSSAIGNVIVRK